MILREKLLASIELRFFIAEFFSKGMELDYSREINSDGGVSSTLKIISFYMELSYRKNDFQRSMYLLCNC